MNHKTSNLKYEKKMLGKINALSPFFEQMTDEELRNYRSVLEQTYQELESPDNLSDAFVTKGFAYAREVTARVLGKRPYDEQILGGLALHQGKVAEMLTGSGKSIPLDTMLPTPTGWVKASDVAVGTTLFSRTGEETRVTGVYPQGKKPLCRLRLRDGRVALASPDHLWEVYVGYKAKKPRVLTTQEMLAIHENHKAKNKKGAAMSLPVAGAVEYRPKTIPIAPYAVGYILGNGCKNKRGYIEVSTADTEVLEVLVKQLGATFAKKTHPNTYTWRLYMDEGKPLRLRDIKGMKQELLDLLSNTLSYKKYIPHEYLVNDIYCRLELLKGLMDADGTIGNYEDGVNRYNVRYSTSSKQLKDDILELLYSLGMGASYYKARTVEKDGELVSQYTISINVDHADKPQLFSLPRKKAIAMEAATKQPKKKNYGKISIVDIELLDEQTEQVCFSVDNPEHLFLMNDFIVTHNTITEILPAFINSFGGNKTHIITVNDYLAKRDSEEMGEVFSFMGRNVGRIYPNMSDKERKKAYQADIIYGTNSEFGFDYLRDNMVMAAGARVQSDLYFCIIDEADSVMIDEAKTPLIISGQASGMVELVKEADALAKAMRKGPDLMELSRLEKIDMEEIEAVRNNSCHYRVDHKNRNVVLTDKGVERMKTSLSHVDELVAYHHLYQALLANNLMEKDKNYIVLGGEIVLIDEATGRKMEGRRFSDGLHQALEAKEGVEILPENVVGATVTLQNYFRLYKKLSGMSGTVASEAKELKETYGTPVVVIPPHQPVIRVDEPMSVFSNKEKKHKAVLERVWEAHKAGRPVLIGTNSIQDSMVLSSVFETEGINHQLLNAKEVEKESYIVAQAGRTGSVTIATNMAGRGTDIRLGGNPEYLAKEKMMKMSYSSADVAHIAAEHLLGVENQHTRLWAKELERQEVLCAIDRENAMKLGGLLIIGTELSDSLRVDNQLRGRAGRQGEPGGSVFYISLQDDLFKTLQGGHRQWLEELLSSGKNIGKKVLSIQKNLGSQSYEQRKNLLELDEIDNIQRKLIYQYRNSVLDGDVSSFGERLKVASLAQGVDLRPYLEAINALTPSEVTQLLLLAIDSNWKSYLIGLQNTKDSVRMTYLSQVKPAERYKNEVLRLFDALDRDISNTLLRLVLAKMPLDG